MPLASLKSIYFSPTRTTQKILQAMAQGMIVDRLESIDLTPPEAETRLFPEIDGELALIGMPVYAGRIPLLAAKRFQRLTAKGTPALIVVVYGNREYEDALMELKDLAIEQGFRPLAAGAFIGEHSYSTETTPIAVGRPDTADLEKAKTFGRKVLEKWQASLREIQPFLLEVPGNSPYKERITRPPESPVTRETLCALCGTCASVCPTAAVTVTDSVVTEPQDCILCQACVKNCPTGARVMEEERVLKIAKWLHTNCSNRKEPELFL